MTLTCALPVESLDDCTNRSPSRPLSFCSMICVTVSSSVWADAPGYVALIAMVGGAIAGYCETGSARIDSTPASMMVIAITHAKIGRSMKYLDTGSTGS
jgi:hypothetical protein